MASHIGLIPTPTLSTELAYYDGCCSENLLGQPAAGAKRLFWCPPVREQRQATGRILPYQLDRPRRHDGVDRLFGVIAQYR